MDIPNERSSHTKVTPRGGGLAIAVTFLGGSVLLTVLGLLPANLGIALFGGGILVAGIGWLDDQKDLSALLRGAVHLIAAVWSLYWLGGLPCLELGFGKFSLNMLGAVLAAIGIVWLINLYNFMDGIDGIAGVEAISVGVLGGILLAVSGALYLAVLCWILAAASVGFLVWNWPPAKIFMGDVGSGLLGYSFAVIAIVSENAETLPLIVWIVLLGIFVVDATVTLLWRIKRGEKFYEAHCEHAYQRTVQMGYTHKQVTLAVLAINMVLGGVAFLMCLWPKNLLMLAIIALGILVLLWQRIMTRFEVYSAAGKTEDGHNLGL